MANLLNERKRKKCVCLCVEFNAAFNNFSVIWRCMVVAGSAMLILNSTASLKYHAPDTRHGATLEPVTSSSSAIRRTVRRGMQSLYWVFIPTIFLHIFRSSKGWTLQKSSWYSINEACQWKGTSWMTSLQTFKTFHSYRKYKSFGTEFSRLPNNWISHADQEQICDNSS